jgi:hypothetical protein
MLAQEDVNLLKELPAHPFNPNEFKRICSELQLSLDNMHYQMCNALLFSLLQQDINNHFEQACELGLGFLAKEAEQCEDRRVARLGKELSLRILEVAKRRHGLIS